jgi:DNA (cytosine-5)-methyltransferase 1
VRFFLLNAVHYGVPQRRIRFFLFAAKRSLRLPEPPRPTHYHRDNEGKLGINFVDAEGNPMTVCPIKAEKSTISLPFVSIEDAIGDLALFDW